MLWFFLDLAVEQHAAFQQHCNNGKQKSSKVILRSPAYRSSTDSDDLL